MEEAAVSYSRHQFLRQVQLMNPYDKDDMDRLMTQFVDGGAGRWDHQVRVVRTASGIGEGCRDHCFDYDLF